MIEYKYNHQLLKIQETTNGIDVEFTLTLLDTSLKNHIKEIRDYFDLNNIVTDVQIYIHPNNRYQIIVRNDFYLDFITELFKHKLLDELKWVK
jgi:uncharacterized protein YajQ (UPF0234 family)